MLYAGSYIFSKKKFKHFLVLKKIIIIQIIIILIVLNQCYADCQFVIMVL